MMRVNRGILSLTELRNLGEGLSISIIGSNLQQFESNPRYKELLNNKLHKDVYLSFGFTDISYIIIEKEADRADMIRNIKYAKQNFDRDTMNFYSLRS